MGRGYYCDFGTSYFRFTIEVSHGAFTGNQAWLRFERGLESLFRRVQFFDIGGNLLESFEHYNETYALQELLTSNKDIRNGVNFMHGEGLKFTKGTSATPFDAGQSGNDVTISLTNVQGTPITDSSGTVTGYNPVSATGTWNHHQNKSGAMDEYPDLGGLLGITSSQAFHHSDRNDCHTLSSPSTGQNTFKKKLTFQLSSSLFGGSSLKYLPLSAISGLRIVLTLDNTVGSMVVGGGLTHADFSMKLTDPTMFLNNIRIDPVLDTRLIAESRGRDGKLRVHSHSFLHYTNYIPATQYSHEYVIPIKVSSLKAIYFAFAPAVYHGVDTFGTNQINQATDMKTSFFQNNLIDYQYFVDGVPTPATPVQMFDGMSEPIAELARSLHFGHKNGDGEMLSLLAPNSINEYKTRNCIFGQEFESFSSKSNVIESGMNTQNSTISLRLNFKPAEGSTTNGTTKDCNLRVWCMYDVFLAMNPDTGLVTVEN
mmetsp:Transcript_8727/g.11505  ORF Transcript_8727/g.11505 Transcript_8727/m.11505 type:complete len:483 (+) Transcript_8727:1404-2852(+)